MRESEVPTEHSSRFSSAQIPSQHSPELFQGEIIRERVEGKAEDRR